MKIWPAEGENKDRKTKGGEVNDLFDLLQQGKNRTTQTDLRVTCRKHYQEKKKPATKKVF